MLKAAEVELVSAGCVCAGKYYIVVAGDVAAVRSSVEAGRETAESQLIDSMVIPNVDSQVAPAISACTLVDRLQALGIMETYSLCAAVQAADAAAKAAEVDLLEVRLGRGLGRQILYSSDRGRWLLWKQRSGLRRPWRRRKD